jgi:hypothetical protein
MVSNLPMNVVGKGQRNDRSTSSRPLQHGVVLSGSVIPARFSTTSAPLQHSIVPQELNSRTDFAPTAR